MLHNSEKDFIKRHIGLSKKDEQKMLSDLGYKSLNALIEDTVPNKILLKDLLSIGEPNSEYEGLRKKLSDFSWKPDYGPCNFNDSVKKSGATAISARDFLVAYNVNLNTTSTRRANSVAFDLREAGRVKREGGTLTGKIITDKNGEPFREPGYFKNLKGILYKWKKTYILMHRIQMKQELYLKKIIILKTMNMKV